MALRKSPVPVSDVSSHLDGLFLCLHCPHSTTQRFNDTPSDCRLMAGCLPRPAVGLPVTPRVLPLCVTASGSAYPDVTNQHNNQVLGSHASWHATIRFASPCLSPHAAPLHCLPQQPPTIRSDRPKSQMPVSNCRYSEHSQTFVCPPRR